MKIVVLDAATLGADLSLEPLSALGDLVVYSATTGEEIGERVADADVIVTNKARLNANTLANAKKLMLIAEAATGYDNIDIHYCRERGIAVANVAGYSTDSVAQVTLATALYLMTHLGEYAAYVADGRYVRSNCFNCLEPIYHEAAGKTWGIVGYGHIGEKVAGVAKALGCRVIAYTRTPKEGVECVSLDTLCRESDIISLHTPLTEQTRGLIGERELSLMRQGCVLVNEARGAVTDEAAVAKAVLEGKILFGCDVFSVEPYPVDHPFASIQGCKNVCMTPHMAWGSQEARQRCLSEICKNIEAFQKGEKRNRIV